MCSFCNVSRSGYYSWLNIEQSKREIANKELDQKITKIFEANTSRYGAPRIARALEAHGDIYSLNRVARRMQKMNLKAIAKKKFKVTTDSEHTKPVYANILNRDFTTISINQKWCGGGDISYVRTDERWMYLAIIIALHSRAVIGWSMESEKDQVNLREQGSKSVGKIWEMAVGNNVGKSLIFQHFVNSLVHFFLKKKWQT